MPSGPALGWPEQSITRSAPKPPTIAEFARELKPRLLGRADADHAAGAHFARGGDGENADRSRALDHHRVSPGESTGADRAVERPDAGGQRLRQRAEPQRHVVGKLVDLGARQHVEVDVDVFREASPQMRRLVEAEIGP